MEERIVTLILESNLPQEIKVRELLYFIDLKNASREVVFDYQMLDIYGKKPEDVILANEG